MRLSLLLLLVGWLSRAGTITLTGVTDGSLTNSCPVPLDQLWYASHNMDLAYGMFSAGASTSSLLSLLPVYGWNYYWTTSSCDYRYTPIGNTGNLHFEYMCGDTFPYLLAWWLNHQAPAGTTALCAYGGRKIYGCYDTSEDGEFDCAQELFTCPVCPRGSYSNQCGGYRDPDLSRACLQCTNTAPRNGIYLLHIAGTTECAVTTCTPGYVAVSPDGFVDSASPTGTCQMCANSLPANAFYLGTDNGGSDNFCMWGCFPGYYLSTGLCLPCWVPPLGATPASPYGGGLSTWCESTCPAGTFLKVDTWSCAPCPNGFYRAQPFAVQLWADLTQCKARCVDDQLAAWASTSSGVTPLACPAGTYAVTDPVTCLLVRCAACAGGGPPAGSYWAVDGTTRLSADPVTQQCYSKPCAYDAAEPGYQLVGCAGTSPGRYVACTGLPANSVYSGRGGCDRIAPCAACTDATLFNAACPAPPGMLSLTAGACNQPCMPTAIANGAYLAPSLRTSVVVTDATACPFACNAGFYASATAVCTRCPTSADCNAGYYIADCQTARACVPCANSAPATGHYRWLPSNPTYGESASCRWLCLQGYYLATGCVPCTRITTCAVGQYLSAPCLAAEGGVTAPACAQCVVPPNAYATGVGAQDNNAASCPFACNAGFFLQGGACVACTPTGACAWTNGTYWGGCAPTADNACIACPAQPPLPTAYIQWSASAVCTWSCAARAYLSGGGCAACLPGTYKAAWGPGPCAPCGPTQFTRDWGSDACKAVPAYATRYADGTGYDCLGGFRADLQTPCVPCVAGAASTADVLAALHLASAQWTPSTCTLTAFACVPGYYRSLSPAPACVACPSGTGVGGGSAVALCGAYPQCASPADELTLACPNTGCPQGSYGRYQLPDALAIVPALVCYTCDTTQCPSGQTPVPCQGGQTAATCGACAPLTAGQVFSGGGCATACAAGYSGGGGGGTCQPCTPGYYTAAVNTLGACNACARGTYATGAGATGCLGCGAGQYAPDTIGGGGGANACLLCAAGTFAAQGGVTVCTACAAGYAAPAQGATACAACPRDAPLATAGRDGCYTPATAADCAASGGFAYLAGACVGCPAGTYCPPGATALTHCPLSAAAPAPRLSASVDACAVAAWPPARGSGVPSPCPANTSTYGRTGAADVAWCYAQQGFYGLPGTAAQPCPYDAYCPPPALAPVPCPAGYYTNRIGATAAADCGSTVMLPPCRPGYYLPFTASACAACPPACYCPGVNNSIAACPSTDRNGAWYTSAGASSADACGPYIANNNFAKTCGAFTSCPQGWVTSWGQCRASPGYYYVPDVADTRVGLLCPPGYYCPPQTLAPLACAVSAACPWLGLYVNPTPCASAGLSAPVPCLSCGSAPPSNGGYYAAPGNCTTCCPDGMLAVNAVCQPHPDSLACPTGYYRPAIPSCTQAFVACAACPVPQTFVPAASNGPGFTAATSCRYACPAGTCLSADGSVCASAPPGAYADASRACVLCPAGQYMPLAGATACYACPPTASASTPGSVYCACPAGSVRSVAASMMTCVVCPPGTAGNGTSCDPCAAGSVWVAPWIAEPACAPGTFRPLPTSSCQACPPNTFSNASEQSACTACAPNAYSNGSASRCTLLPPAAAAVTTCAAAYSVAANGSCACMGGTYGDGYSSCAPCAVPSQCVCPPDTFFLNGACVACRVCPAFAATRNRCLWGSTADTVACVCPADHYYHAGRGDCFPCSDCAPFANRTRGCTVGATRDATLCACNAGYVGDGVSACVCAPLTYAASNGSCVACRACSPNATRLAYCASGSTSDTTRCGACLFGTSGDGFTCR